MENLFLYDRLWFEVIRYKCKLYKYTKYKFKQKKYFNTKQSYHFL